MHTVGVFEAKAKLSALIDAVANGESVVITRNGRSVARLIPAEISSETQLQELLATLRGGVDQARAQRRAWIDRIKDLRARCGARATLDEAREWREEGRR